MCAPGGGVSSSPRAAPGAVGLRVRIRLAPAASPSLQCTAELRAKSLALSRDSAHRWGRETGWADRKPALSGVFSLTGIDAVPPWGSADYVQRRASRGDNRGWGISSFVDYAVRSLCCSAQLSGRSSSVRRVAVSSTGCRPCKIASPRMVVLCVEQNKPGPDTAPLDADGGGQLDSAVAGRIRCG